MIHHTHPFLKKTLLFLLIFIFASTSVLFAQAGKKTIKEQGFVFQYPDDWNLIDMGSDDYEGTAGYTKALSPPDTTNFAMVIMFFPKFTLDLAAAELSYPDFMKMVFENFLEQGSQAHLTIEATDAKLKHGKVSAFMVVDEKSEGSSAAIICGDLRKGSAAIIMVSIDMPSGDSEKAKTYLTQAEEIMASFTFPK